MKVIKGKIRFAFDKVEIGWKRKNASNQDFHLLIVFQGLSYQGG